MRLSTIGFFMILSTALLAACGRDEMASLTDRQDMFYGRTGTTQLATRSIGALGNTAMAAPVESIAANELSPASGKPITSGTWQWPTHGRIIQRFGATDNASGHSEGIVIAAAEGAPIRASRAGDVAFVGEDTDYYGNIVILKHADGSMSSYAHARSLLVNKDQRVEQGTILGYVGKSGSANEPQLHFALREGTQSVDPLSRLPVDMAASQH